jgi:hypothetical protein
LTLSVWSVAWVIVMVTMTVANIAVAAMILMMARSVVRIDKHALT